MQNFPDTFETRKRLFASAFSICMTVPLNTLIVVKQFLSRLISYQQVIKYNKLLNKYTKIRERVSSLMNIKFDIEPVYGDNDKYIKTKIKSYGDKINTNFQGKKIPKENASYKCLSLLMLNSAIRANKKYYPQTHLEECKYEIKKNKQNGEPYL